MWHPWWDYLDADAMVEVMPEVRTRMEDLPAFRETVNANHILGAARKPRKRP
jgi:hypothetical protein